MCCKVARVSGRGARSIDWWRAVPSSLEEELKQCVVFDNVIRSASVSWRKAHFASSYSIYLFISIFKYDNIRRIGLANNDKVKQIWLEKMKYLDVKGWHLHHLFGLNVSELKIYSVS